MVRILERPDGYVWIDDSMPELRFLQAPEGRQLSPEAFYLAVGRSDLAKELRDNEKEYRLMRIFGPILLVVGAGSAGLGIHVMNECLRIDGQCQAAAYGSLLVGTACATMGLTFLIWGLAAEPDPVPDLAGKRLLADEANRKLRAEAIEGPTLRLGFAPSPQGASMFLSGTF